MKHNEKTMKLKEGDVVTIKGDEKNRAKWKLGIVDQLYPGRDGIVRAVRLRAGKSYLERPVQHLYPLELSCCEPWVTEKVRNAKTSKNEDLIQRPQRTAAANARLKINIITDGNSDYEDHVLTLLLMITRTTRIMC